MDICPTVGRSGGGADHVSSVTARSHRTGQPSHDHRPAHIRISPDPTQPRSEPAGSEHGDDDIDGEHAARRAGQGPDPPPRRTRRVRRRQLQAGSGGRGRLRRGRALQDVGPGGARRVRTRASRFTRGARAHRLRRPVRRLGADGRVALDRGGRVVPRRDGDQGTVRGRAVPGDRRPGDRPRHRDDGGRRLPPERIVELRLRPAARRPHPHPRHHPGDRRTTHLRRTGRQGGAGTRQLGRHGTPRDREHRLHPHRRLRPRGLLPLRVHPRTAARRFALPPRDHRHRGRVPLRLGVRRRDGACSTS